MSESNPSSTPPPSPPPFRIELTDIWSFYNWTCRHLPQQICEDLYIVFRAYNEHKKSLLDLEIDVLRLIHDYPIVVQGFKKTFRHFLGEEEYLDKVRVRLLTFDNATEYLNFLKYLRIYNNKMISFAKFKEMVGDSFHKHPDLWESFDAYFENMENNETSDKQHDANNSDEKLEKKTTDEEGDENLDNVLKEKNTDEERTQTNEADASSSEPLSKKQKTQ